MSGKDDVFQEEARLGPRTRVLVDCDETPRSSAPQAAFSGVRADRPGPRGNADGDRYPDQGAGGNGCGAMLEFLATMIRFESYSSEIGEGAEASP